ncbi:hypothetical protein QCA50_002108 [Cerrena zonata]|uniref:Uncharacterized protein n=1 Tax=Cerrena zonata TaxID=2478898 RepID=A0AAW0GNZ5_9APHY
MSIPRSKSAPHVPDSAVKTKKDGQTKPKLPRHASAITLGSSTFTSPHAYPYHSPREHEPEEDPFSLAGFFPNGLGLAQKWRDNAWKWLRDTDEDETEEDVILPRTMSPVSEDEEWLPRTPGSMLTPVADTTTQATIEKGG